MADELDVIEPGIPVKDGCPILRRIKAFVSSEGVPATLQYTFRHPKTGASLNLEAPCATAVSNGSDVSDTISETLIDNQNDAVIVKFREFTGLDENDCSNPIITVGGTAYDRQAGEVRAVIPQKMSQQSGLYTVCWGYARDGQYRLIQNSLLSIERTSFGGISGQRHTAGPPTLGEIRMYMRDSDPRENPLLRDVEFDDDQILMALAMPIREFNEMNPPLHQRWDCRNFPWKHNWIQAVRGYLCATAADYYRRNRFNVVGGGKQLDELNRAPEYDRAAQTLLAEWRDWAKAKKVAINATGAMAVVGSGYGSWSDGE